MVLRPYAPSDCQALAELFHHTVHTVNAGDYTPEQLDAWSPGAVDLEGWNRSFLEHHRVEGAGGTGKTYLFPQRLCRLSHHRSLFHPGGI